MPNLIPLNLAYDHTIRPAWTVQAALTQEARHIRQHGGPGQFAIVMLHFQHWIGDAAVQLLDGADRSAAANECWSAAECDVLIDAIGQGISTALNDCYQAQRPLVQLQITLLSFRVHAVDSNQFAYRIAAALCVQQMLAKAVLVPLT